MMMRSLAKHVGVGVVGWGRMVILLAVVVSVLLALGVGSAVHAAGPLASIAFGLESAPVIGPTAWSADVVDEFGDLYRLRISSIGRSGPMKLVAIRLGSFAFAEGRLYVADQGLSGWAAGAGVAVENPPPLIPSVIRWTLLYRRMAYSAGHDYVRPAFPGDPGMFLVDSTGRRWFVETGTPVRLEGERGFIQAETTMEQRLTGWLRFAVSAGWMIGGPTEMRALAKAVSYPETDIVITGKGPVGSPSWEGFYWRLSIGGEW